MVRNLIAFGLLAAGAVLSLAGPDRPDTRRDLARICEGVEGAVSIDHDSEALRMFRESPGPEGVQTCAPSGCSVTCDNGTCSTGCKPGARATCFCFDSGQPVCSCVRCE